MSIRNLDSLFDPSSIAVIGASEQAGSVGATVWRNLTSSAGPTRFAGPVWPVNPKRREIGGVQAYARVADLPHTPELAVVCVPPGAVPGVIADLGARGTRAAVVITAGLDAAQKQAMLDAARPHLMRVLGPNGLGLLSPHVGLNASFAHIGAAPGSIAFVSQSGALMTALLDWAAGRGIGFSHFASLGESADVDFGDMLDYLASDPRTKAVLLYIESIRSPRKFMSAARAAARNKPVIVVKSGRSAAGQAAARSHTGALAGSDLVFDAAIRRAGMLRVDTLADLFLAAEALSRHRGAWPVAASGAVADGHGLVILTNGGGAGVMAADAAVSLGVPLATLGAQTVERLDAALPANWSRANPVDIIGDAPCERYVSAMSGLLADPACDALLFIHAPTAIVPSADIAQALNPVATAARNRILGCWLGGPAVAQAQQLFQQAGIPSYATPEEAVRAFSMLVDYRRNQAQLMEAPPAGGAGSAAQREERLKAVRQAMAAAQAEGRELLTEPEAKALLAACGVPVVATQVAPADPDAVVQAAELVGLPVALKILSTQITHKSDVGGVALNLDTPQAVREAAVAMLERVRALRPDADLQGFTVQQMVRRGHAQELIVGASIDTVFGPVILFGAGGTAVEVLADRAIALPPLNAPLARALVERTRVARLLAGYRDRPAADIGALESVLVAVSQLLADVPEVAELDINPLLLDERGAIALDARVRLSSAKPAGAARFAIRPYPDELIESASVQGRDLTLRPIRPEDETQHREFLESLDPEDLRMRIFYSRRGIERSELARLTQIDYEREMAFVAVEPVPGGGERTLGVVRVVIDPDNRDAEFGIIVRTDLKGAGLGSRLMRKMIAYLRARGTRHMVGTVLAANPRMLDLAERLGFEIGAVEREEGTRPVRLVL
jgi:acetyltransferase